MIDHISIGVSDLEASTAFYEPILAAIGLTKLADRADTVGFGKKYPEFWINRRRGMAPVTADSGVHVCLRVRSESAVDAFHTGALAAGAADTGAPGLRPEYSANYYGAFIQDLDGNKIEVVTFV